MASCAFCGGNAQYRDRQTGQYVCPEHARLEVVAAGRGSVAPPLTVRPASPADLPRIEALALYFWDETEVDCFGQQYNVLACPAFLACAGNEVVGLAPYAVEREWEAVVVVTLNLLPDFQGRGGGRALLDAVREEAVRRGLARMLVATSNDDLPALSLYQRYGFRLVALLPGRLAEHHGGELPGFAGIPVRDEVRLEHPIGNQLRTRNTA